MGDSRDSFRLGNQLRQSSERLSGAIQFDDELCDDEDGRREQEQTEAAEFSSYPLKQQSVLDERRQ